VYCVAYSSNGKRFASGGADRMVIIWTSQVSRATAGNDPPSDTGAAARHAAQHARMRAAACMQGWHAGATAGRSRRAGRPLPPAAQAKARRRRSACNLPRCNLPPGFQGEGILRYSHNDSIQSLAYNPVTHVLASTTAGDLGLWSPEQKNVSKIKVGPVSSRQAASGPPSTAAAAGHQPPLTSRPWRALLQLPSSALCSAWSLDGAVLAIGCQDGSITFRDRAGTEQDYVETGTSAVRCLAWSQEVRLCCCGMGGRVSPQPSPDRATRSLASPACACHAPVMRLPCACHAPAMRLPDPLHHPRPPGRGRAAL